MRKALATLAVILLALPAGASPPVSALPTPSSTCAAGSRPETEQGRAPLADVATGRAARGYSCNTTEIGHYPGLGGYRVERYVDRSGHECAFYDSEASFGANQPDAGPTNTGVYVLDVHDPAHPVRTAVLRTAAMQSPHESLRLNAARGLLAAAMSTPATGPGIVDIYDVSKDCRKPALASSTPLGILGHESGFAPDGRTFYVSSLAGHTLAGIDVTDPTKPLLRWVSYAFQPHGVSISDDGRTMYLAEIGYEPGSFTGLTVLDVSQVQARATAPVVRVLSRLTWPRMSSPQNATPFTRHGHRYVLEFDEFGERTTGAARILDAQDLAHPFVVSNLRLRVNQADVYDSLQDDPGNSQSARGYQAHYCSLPSRVDPNLVACSFIMSGLRVFDIRDPARPIEVGYFNKPNVHPANAKFTGSFAMSAPAYDPTSHDIWYADGNSGFYVVRLSGVTTSFATTTRTPGN